MIRPCLSALVLLGAAPTGARAEEHPLPFTYAAFEEAVPHIDLMMCPERLDQPGRFCRATLANDRNNVFVFAEDGDQPLVAFQSWPADLLNGLMD